jgi:seryl-tRNA synthetase
MADADNGKQKTINVPTWFLDLLKLCIPAALVLVAMFYQIRALETGHNELKTQFNEKSKQVDVAAREVDMLKITTGATNTAMTSTLARIEKDIGEIKTDVKQLQQTGKNNGVVRGPGP